MPAWNGPSTSPDIRGETQNASVQERAAAAATKPVDLMVAFATLVDAIRYAGSRIVGERKAGLIRYWQVVLVAKAQQNGNAK